jgi:hypothetical protein
MLRLLSAHKAFKEQLEPKELKVLLALKVHKVLLAQEHTQSQMLVLVRIQLTVLAIQR